MSKLRARALCAAVLIGLLSLSACGDDGESDASAPTDDRTTAGSGSSDGGDGCTPDRVGGSITVGEYSPTLGLDPIDGGGSGLSSGRVGGIPGAAIYDTLLILDEETGEFIPHVAESIKSSDDRTTWTLKLRPGITFSNGDPLDADAVVASMKRHTAEGSPSTIRRGLELIEEYVVVDDLTVEFHLSAPWGYFPMALASSAGMITNQRIVEERGEGFNLDPSGAGVGPYEIERFVPREELVLRAKDDYWGGPVCIERLRFVHLQGAGLTYESLKRGEIDIAFLQEAEVIARAKEEGFDGLTWVLQAGALLLMNTGVEGTDPPTADLRVRQAIVHALDPEAMDERRFAGTGLPTASIVHEDFPFAPSVSGPELDSERARALVEEVKAETGWDGTIRILCNEDAREAAVTAQALLNAAGMQVQTSVVDTAGLIRGVIVEKNFDLPAGGSTSRPATCGSR